MPELSTPIESIPSMDVLVALGRGPNDYDRAWLVASIAEAVAARQQSDPSRARNAEFLGPLVFLCGNEPWHRATGSAADGRQLEAMGMIRHVHRLIDQTPESYRHLTKDQFKTVGGDSTIASMVAIAKTPELEIHPAWSMTFLTDELHNKYGRVDESALAVFGLGRVLNVVTYRRPHALKEGPMEVGMSLLTHWALRTVEPGDADGAAIAQQRIERVVGAIRR